jgi:hypothetical protein
MSYRVQVAGKYTDTTYILYLTAYALYHLPQIPRSTAL